VATPWWILIAALAVCAGAAHAGPQGTGEIVIGLIVPSAGPDAAAGREASCGSEAAVRRAQHEGGTQGRSIRLVTAASQNPWDDAARQVARLIHQDGARIVVGGLDAATAHAAEQVIVRERGAAAFISLWASESALTQLPVPWYFSAVPEDRRQARALAREIFEARGARGAAVYADGSREGRSLAAAFEAASPAGAVARLAAEDPDALERLLMEIGAGRVQAVVLAAPPAGAARAARELSRRAPQVALFGPLRLATPAFGRPQAEDGAGAGSARPAGARVQLPWPEVRDAGALEALTAACGEVTPLSIYAYDAVSAAVEALQAPAMGAESTLDRRLAAVSAAGAAGPVRFAAARSRAGMPAWREVAVPAEAGDRRPAAHTNTEGAAP
jgi:branched-chain amino acid transport system substrate-binding protein